MIWLAYVAIPVVLVLYARKRRDLPFRHLYWLFGIFIIGCGFTHFMAYIATSWPAFRLEGLIKGITALASWGTVLAMIQIAPRALSMRMPEELEREIEARKQAEAALREANARLKAFDDLKTQFFASVSHELRTPLTLILGPLRKQLREGRLTAESRRDLKTVERNASLLLKQVNDLLDLSKLEAGQMALAYTDVDLARFGQRIASYFEALAAERQIHFLVETPRTLRAQVDPEKLQRVLLNLLSNAFKFVPDGGLVRFTLRQEPSRAVFRIEDNGPGVPAHLWEAIFERFRQGERESARDGGTGLGLAIAREFVDLHHGRIAAGDSSEGGALFRVELPLRAPAGTEVAPSKARPDDAALRAAIERLQPDAGGDIEAEPAEADSDRPLVLIIEDNPEMNAFVSGCLAREYRIARAYDGQEGLEMALRLHPDLILTDLMMPRLSGDKVVMEIRRQPGLKDVPIMLLTARTDEAQRVQLLREGAQDYLQKPFLEEELLARAGRLIEERRKTEASIHEAYGLLRAVTETIADTAVFVKDHQGRYLLINTVGARLAGKTVEEMLGRDDRQLFDSVTAEILQQEDRQVLETGETKEYETEVTVEGRALTLLSTKGPYRDKDGGLLGVAGMSRDISERKRAEREIVALNQRLKRAMAETHHRIKNSLQIICGLMEMQCQKDSETVPKAEVWKLIRHTRALAAVHDLLTQSARQNGEMEEVSARAMLEKLIHVAQVSAGNRQIQLQVEDMALPPRYGTSIAILTNELISNAVKHGEGDIELSLATREEAIRLEVRDRGPGFPDGFDSETTTSTGLELIDQISRWDLQGCVEYTNHPNGGACVAVTFPREAGAVKA